MLDFVIYAVELLVCFLLQNTVLINFDIAGIVPDLIVILVVSVGYQKGRLHGMVIGLFGGLILDLTFGSLIGVYALVYMFIGYGVGMLSHYYIKYDTFLPLALIAVSEFIYTLYGYLVNMLTAGRFELLYYMRRIMFPSVFYTLIVGVFLYKLLDYIYISVLMPVEEEN